MPEFNWRIEWAKAVAQSKRDYAHDNPEIVRPGYWAAQLRKGTAEIPCAIWCCTHEPDNPENILEVPIFIGAVAGKEVDPLDVMVVILGGRCREITEKAYAARTGEFQWVAQFGDEDDPLKHPTRRPDLMKLKPVGPNG